MPGIHEDNSTVESETAVSTEETPQTEEQSESSSTSDESAESPPPRQLDQTDKVNKFLLKSFLEHINTHPINMQTDSAEETAGNSNDWN